MSPLRKQESMPKKWIPALYVFSLGTDFTGVVAGRGLEARDTRGRDARDTVVFCTAKHVPCFRRNNKHCFHNRSQLSHADCGVISSQSDVYFGCNRANVLSGESVVFCAGEVFEHERHVGQLAQFCEKCSIVQSAQAGPNLVEMGHELFAENDVLGVTTLDVWAELLEALAN